MAVASPLLLSALQLSASLAGGPAAEPSPIAAFAAAVHDGSALELDVAAPRVEDARIRIDARADEAAWAEAAVLRGFTQYEPVEGAPASQPTEVRVLLTDDALYFSVVALDAEGAGIRATLAERDGYGRSDDYVRVVLDTFDDQRRAYVFQVNPLGVQADGLWVEGRGGRGDPIDWNPDFLWESSGRVGTDRWVAELKIPLKSLRFPEAPVQDWGLQVMRRIQRNGFEQSWAPLTSDRANRLEQSGRLRGLRGLDAGLFMELNPVVTGSRVGAPDEESGAFRRDGAAWEAGLNVTYGLTSNLTLDGTWNPDFSQVEADAGQITANERFAIRLPEKRPFFLEGADLFALPAPLVYTRRIARPVGAAKLSGKVGGFGVAWLAAVDEGADGAGNPVVNLLRVKRDVGESSTVGLLYTDRTTPGEGFNRVAAADGRLVLGGRYTLDLLAAGSADAPEGVSTDLGSLVLARFRRSGRSVSLGASFEDVSDGFRARSGFVRRVGVTEAEARAGYDWRGGRGALVERWGPSVEVEGTWDRDAFWSGRGPLEATAELSLSASLRGNLGGWLSLSRTRFSVPDRWYEGLRVAGADGAALATDAPFAPDAGRFSGLDAVRVRAWIGAWERARGSVGASWSETPIFDREMGLPVEVGESLGADAEMTLYLTGSLTAETGVRHSTIRRATDGSTYSVTTIPRIRARYQFSRSLFARATGEYAFRERDAVRDPATGGTLAFCDDAGCALQDGSDAYDLGVEALLAYEPSPGTVFFLGYSRSMADEGGFRFRDLDTREDGLFVKLSYRFRM